MSEVYRLILRLNYRTGCSFWRKDLHRYGLDFYNPLCVCVCVCVYVVYDTVLLVVIVY